MNIISAPNSFKQAVSSFLGDVFSFRNVARDFKQESALDTFHNMASPVTSFVYNLYKDSMDHSNGQFAQDVTGDLSPGSSGYQPNGSPDLAPDSGQSPGDYNYNDSVNAGQTDRDAWEEIKTYLQGLLSSTGQIQDDNRHYNAAQAAEQRKWLEYMSNTTYQRAVEDMRKAGINPVLAAGGSFGTSSVSGAASASSNNVTGDTIGGLLNTLLSFVGDILPSVSKVFNENISQITSNSTSSSTNINHNFNHLTRAKK